MLVPIPPAATAKPRRILDVECYRNFFLVKLYDLATKQFFSIRLSASTPFNWLALRMLMTECTIITFNGNKYDMLMVSAVATGRFTNDMLKNLSDHIIKSGRKGAAPIQPWMIAQDWGFEILNLDHIDLFEISPGDGSLKIYGGRLHCKTMQDLPVAVDAILTPQQMDEIDAYCGNDLITTADLFFALEDDIDTRIELTAQYGVDMRSKSDAQIAEAAFKKLLGLDYKKSQAMVRAAQLLPGTICKYRGPAFLKFNTPEMQDAYARVLRANFVISDKGQPIEPPELAGFDIKLGGAVYRMGIGGLHSSEKKVSFRAGPTCVLTDFDVASYYPKIISILRLYPNQIGPVFLTIYDGWITVRLEYKNKGEKKKAATFKIKLNGTFGKSNSKYSIIFSPDMFIQIVLTGQLSLLMLIDMLYIAGMGTAQTNTDGVVVNCTPAQVPLRDAIVKEWEARTGFTMEGTDYMAVFSRDVNAYLAVKPGYVDKKGIAHSPEWKAKGPYGDPGLSKNPANVICLDAIKAFIMDGTALETTIRRCDDIRKFVTVRGVQGGGVWVRDTIIADRVAEKRGALESRLWVFNPRTKLWSDIFGGGIDLSLDDALKVVRDKIDRQYLGKAVRWYYAKGERGHIAYATNGNLVARSEGARPCMTLPDVLPPDIDYDWYVQEARGLLADVGLLTS